MSFAEIARQQQIAAFMSVNVATRHRLAKAIRRHPDTIRNWARGKTMMSVSDFCLACEFFDSRGDGGFRATVLAPAIAARRRGADEYEQKARDLRNRADAMTGSKGGKA